MYYDFFGFREPPFSIAPDPRYLYLSERHKEALAHLMYGVQGQGGFIVITGEVGTGKTTISRCFIENVPDHVDIALVLNPKLSARELLSSICDELEIAHPAGSSIKRLIDLINADLLAAHAAGRHKVLIIDEAQNLSAEVLEQLRLLTNLETAEKKLLQIVLLGQPELQEILARPDLRQLSQRVTARYHLDALDRSDLPGYLSYRVSVAGQRSDLFTPAAISELHRRSGGVPRLINLISDRALLGAYAEGEHRVGRQHIRSASREVQGGKGWRRRTTRQPGASRSRWVLPLLAGIAVIALAAVLMLNRQGVATLDQAMSVVASGPIERVAGESDTPPTVQAPENSGSDATVGQTSASAEAPEPSPTAEPPAFTLAQDGQTLAGAFSVLFGAWGVDYVAANHPVACDFAETLGLRCLNRQGNWRSLIRLDRPAILELRADDGSKQYVTVLHADASQATIGIAGNRTLSVPVSELEQYWYGDYSILWRLPPYLSQQPDSSKGASEDVWLSAQLMQLIDRLADGAEERSRLASLSQEDQVRWYQRQRGLTNDGIAGTMTLIQLNEDLNPGVPRLTPQREAD